MQASGELLQQGRVGEAAGNGQGVQASQGEDRSGRWTWGVGLKKGVDRLHPTEAGEEFCGRELCGLGLGGPANVGVQLALKGVPVALVCMPADQIEQPGRVARLSLDARAQGSFSKIPAVGGPGILDEPQAERIVGRERLRTGTQGFKGGIPASFSH